MIPHAIILSGRGDKLHRNHYMPIQRVRKSTVDQDRAYYERKQAVWNHKAGSFKKPSPLNQQAQSLLMQSIGQQLQQLSLNAQPKPTSSSAI